MYRKGLPSTDIARLVGVPHSTLRYHLLVAKSMNPELADEHRANVRRRVSPRSLRLMEALIARIKDTGRYPSSKDPDHKGRSLFVWLNRRRMEDAAGTLHVEIREGLDAALPGWRGTRRVVADEALWQKNLAELATYRAGGNDWPRRRNAGNEEERKLGAWLSKQRRHRIRETLDSARSKALDEKVPGWTQRRKRSPPKV
ncbi:helicase associated domain-containing protein [Arthrobacter oryzae]|uniref:helicase associated domain-containing protein n=1 Tax=Arthrobacter oryzae TaxID=409290 RepID=UPI002782B25E|nr:helicase associated domain-containing protein [Arthrobacter oryzae]MDQ0076785.1 hypothetical protein [Arthrobacter oryzae]